MKNVFKPKTFTDLTRDFWVKPDFFNGKSIVKKGRFYLMEGNSKKKRQK